MRTTLLAVVFLALSAGMVSARVGDPVAAFASGPLIQQLRLTPSSQAALSGELAGRLLHRYVSDDQAITVDLVVRGGMIEQQLMYLPMDLQRGIQVSFFLQDATGSVFAAQQGMLAWRAAITNRTETYRTFGGYTMRFTPMAGLMRVLVSP